MINGVEKSKRARGFSRVRTYEPAFKVQSYMLCAVKPAFERERERSVSLDWIVAATTNALVIQFKTKTPPYLSPSSFTCPYLFFELHEMLGLIWERNA